MTMTPTFTVGELLRKARLDAGYDQEGLAAALGVARNTVSNYETGRSMPALDVAARWSRVTGVSIEWLAAGVETAPVAGESAEGRSVHPPGLEPGTH